MRRKFDLGSIQEESIKTPEEWAEVARAAAQSGQWHLSRTFWANAIALNPSNPTYLFERGKILLDVKEYQLALADFFDCLSLDYPKPGRVYYQMTCCYQKLNDIRNAMLYIEKALEIFPESTEYKNKFMQLKGGFYSEPTDDPKIIRFRQRIK